MKTFPKIFAIIAGTATLLSINILSAQTVEILDGIRFVHNEQGGMWGDRPRIRLEPIRTIGGWDEQDVNLTFKAPYDVALDTVGNIHILDTGDNRIQKLDPDGGFIKTIGRPGQGPGDFQSPFSLDIDKNGFLFVFDAMNMRIQVLDGDGKFHNAIRLKSPGVYQIRRLENGLIAKAGKPNLRDLIRNPKEIPWLVEFFERDGTVTKSFGQARDYNDAHVNAVANECDLDTDKDDHIYLSFRYQNRIEKYSPDGTLLWRADRPLNYETDVLDKGAVRRDEKGISIQEPRLNIVSFGIAVDDKGRIWVVTLRRQMSLEEQGIRLISSKGTGTAKETKEASADVYMLEIFNGDGVLLGGIPLSHHAHGIRISGSTLFVWERNNAMIYQYKIVDESR